MAIGVHSDRRTGASAVVDALGELGVDTVFGLPGVHNLAIWRELRPSSLRLVGVRHEQAAAYAADGYARASGRLGAALVTSGPGAANTLAAVGEAAASHSPVLVIATDVPAALRRPGVVRGLLHESRDQRALFVPLVKDAIDVTAAGEIAGTIARAGALALAAPAGPVYVGIAADLLDAELGHQGPSAAAEKRPAAARAHRTDAGPSTEDAVAGPGPAALAAEVANVAGMLSRAARPLIWAGGGAVHAEAGAAVTGLAERLASPVVTTYQGRGLVPPDHPCAAPGPVHTPEIGALWDEADVVIAVGSDLDAMMTQNWRMPRPPVLIAVNVDAVDAAKNWAPDAMIADDARAGVEAILAALAGEASGPLDALARRLHGIRAEVRARIADDEPQALVLLDALTTGLPDNTVIVADMCIAGYWVGAFHPVPAPRRLAYPVGWGTLGFAFPAALGSALAHDGPTVCICGDGGFLMACGELATAAQEQIPLTVVLFDDHGYGMLRFDQQRAATPSFGVDLASPDFIALAQSFGVDAERVGLDALGDALERHTARPQPTMVVVDAAMRPPPTTSPRWYRPARAIRSGHQAPDQEPA